MAKPQEKTRKTLSIKTEDKPAKQVPESPTSEKGAGADEPTAAVLHDEDTSSIRVAISCVEDWFKNIGTSIIPETELPRAKNRNNADEAAEFVLAEKLRKLAEERYKIAKEKAEKAGIFGEPEEYRQGETVMVWNSPHYAVSVKQGKASQMINKDLVEAKLTEIMGAHKAAEAMEGCMKTRNAPTQIIVSVK